LKVFAKILPSFEYFIYTRYRISEASYRNELDKHGGTGQGNLFTGKSCKVKSCLIINRVEEKGIGIIIVTPISLNKVKRTVIAFVDNSSFY